MTRKIERDESFVTERRKLWVNTTYIVPQLIFYPIGDYSPEARLRKGEVLQVIDEAVKSAVADLYEDHVEAYETWLQDNEPGVYDLRKTVETF